VANPIPVSASIPPRILKSFAQTALAEVGNDTMRSLVSKAGLGVALADALAPARFSPEQSAELYASLQAAFREYYGRNARNLLTRIGRRMWQSLMQEASLVEKAQAQLVRAIPLNLRRKPALEYLVGFLRTDVSAVTVHSLDMDLMLEDQFSPITLGQQDRTPICALTVGMIQETLYWAMGKEHDVEEVACRAAGAQDCEFHIRTGA
jgi:predicted hydrocarbon binding protein